jgi:uncharacterized protein YkwD
VANVPGSVFRPPMLAQLNAARLDAGRPAVVMHAVLNPAAQNQAKHCALVGGCTHTGPDGSDVWQRLVRGGYALGSATEVLADLVPDQGDVARSAKLAVELWLSSTAGHREAVLGDFVHCGIGRAEGPTGRVYWAVVFGRPAPQEE